MAVSPSLFYCFSSSDFATDESSPLTLVMLSSAEEYEKPQTEAQFSLPKRIGKHNFNLATDFPVEPLLCKTRTCTNEKMGSIKFNAKDFTIGVGT